MCLNCSYIHEDFRIMYPDSQSLDACVSLKPAVLTSCHTYKKKKCAEHLNHPQPLQPYKGLVELVGVRRKHGVKADIIAWAILRFYEKSLQHQQPAAKLRSSKLKNTQPFLICIMADDEIIQIFLKVDETFIPAFYVFGVSYELSLTNFYIFIAHILGITEDSFQKLQTFFHTYSARK